MPNMRLNLTRQDRKALETFFTNRTYKKGSDFMKLAETWKSTTAISNELNESGKRTLQRLEKLSGFGLVEFFSVPYHDRMDRYWTISRDAVYYMLSTFDGVKFMAFLRTNKQEIRNFQYIEDMVLKRDVQVRYLTSQMKNIVNNYQYYLIKGFIEKWLDDNFGTKAVYHFFHPNIKEVLKRVYGKDKEMMEKLSHIYGRMD
jgi:hypothetical protein